MHPDAYYFWGNLLIFWNNKICYCGPCHWNFWLCHKRSWIGSHQRCILYIFSIGVTHTHCYSSRPEFCNNNTAEEAGQTRNTWNGTVHKKSFIICHTRQSAANAHPVKDGNISSQSTAPTGDTNIHQIIRNEDDLFKAQNYYTKSVRRRSTQHIKPANISKFTKKTKIKWVTLSILLSGWVHCIWSI